MDPKDLMAVMVFLAALGTAAWTMYLFTDSRKRQRRLKAQSELNGKLLEKFSSAREMAEFLQTDGGAHFMDSFSGDREYPATAILRSTHRGIVMAVLAVGCLGLAWHFRDSENPLLVIGVVLLSLGIGFLISALVSHRLSKVLAPPQQ